MDARLRLPQVKFVSADALPFTTLGTWDEVTPGEFHILVVDMPDWRYSFIVLLHELTEWAICQHDGVSTDKCNEFDEWFEGEYEAGRKKLDQEPGCDKKCPYYKGHMWGIRMERLFCFLLGIRWREYCRVCQDVIDDMWEMQHAP